MEPDYADEECAYWQRQRDAQISVNRRRYLASRPADMAELADAFRRDSANLEMGSERR